MKSCKSSFVVLCAVLAMLALAGGQAQANGTAYYFDVDGDTPGFGTPSGSYDLNASALWSTDPTGSSTTAPFNPSWDPGVQWTFGDPGLDFAGTPPFTFTINANGATDWFRINGIAVNSTNANITLAGNNKINGSGSDQTWYVATGSTLTVNGDYAGIIGGMNWGGNGDGITFTGGGTFNCETVVGALAGGSTLTFSGPVVNLQAASNPNDYSWNTMANYTLTAGTLNFATTVAAGAFRAFGCNNGVLTISGGTIDNTSSSAMTLDLKGVESGQGVIKIGGDFTFAGSSDLSFGTTPVTLTATPQITVTNNLTIGGVISGSGLGLTKAGTGTLTLTGANSYDGNTTVSAGTLSIANAYLADFSTVTIADTGATLDLTFEGSDTVGGFVIGGTAQPYGVYGAIGSGAEHPIDQITGSGTLTVAAPVLSTACDILTFGANVPGSSVIITTTSPTAGTVAWTVPYGTTVADLAPTFTMSPHAACNNQPNGGIPTPALSTTVPVTYTVTAQAGNTKDYAVLVTVASPPSNDNFADAIALTGAEPGQTGDATGGTQTGTGNIGATTEPDEPAFTAGYEDPNLQKTVWFKWTCGAADGIFTINTAGTKNLGGQDWDAVVYIYDGNTLATLNQLAFSDNGQAELVSQAVTAGTTYYIRLSWGGGPTGNAATQRDTPNIVLTWSWVPLSTACDILTFGANVAGSSAIITTTSPTTGTVAWTVPYGTTVADLAPTFTMSPDAACNNQPNGGIPTPALSTTTPVTYTVTAQAGNTKDYAVLVTVAAPGLVFGAEQYDPFGHDPSPIGVVSGDLLETSVASVTGEPGTISGTPGPALRDGTFDSYVMYSDSGYTTTYALDTTTHPLGYDIKEIRLFSNGGSRTTQAYDIKYSLVGAPDTFLLLGTYTGTLPPSADGTLMTRTYDNRAATPDAGPPILTGVAAIQFVIRANGNGTLYREWDVTGSATGANPTGPSASFAALGPTSGTLPPGLTVNFTNTSTAGDAPIATNYWAFGDGGYFTNTTSDNVSHPYNSIGTYTVILTVSDTNNLTSIATSNDYIMVTARPPVAPPEMLSGKNGFYLDPATGHATVKFTAQDGVQYTLEYKDDLLASVPGWQPCCEPITTNGTPQIMLQDTNDTHTVTQRYYRIEANYP